MPTIGPARERDAPHPLANLASEYSKLSVERMDRKRDSEALGSLLDQYKKDGDLLSFAMNANRDPNLSPTTRANTTNLLVNFSKHNAAQQKEVLKKQEKLDKENLKETKEKEYDTIERDLYQEIEGKNLSTNEIIKKGLDRNLPWKRVREMANINRMEGREDRLSEKDILSLYDSELKDYDRQIKSAGSDDELKAPLIAAREKVKQQRQKDLSRYRNGEKKFQLSLFEGQEPIQQAAEEQAAEEQDPFILKLNKIFPPSSVPPGTSKWTDSSKTGEPSIEYKSDGEKWVRVS